MCFSRIYAYINSSCLIRNLLYTSVREKGQELCVCTLFSFVLCVYPFFFCNLVVLFSVYRFSNFSSTSFSGPRGGGNFRSTSTSTKYVNGKKIVTKKWVIYCFCCRFINISVKISNFMRQLLNSTVRRNNSKILKPMRDAECNFTQIFLLEIWSIVINLCLLDHS